MEKAKTPREKNKTEASAQSHPYWKSLDEKYQTPEFMELAEKEFQSSPLKAEEDQGGLARRQFMKLMGASIALSSAACVRRPVQKIIPYNKRPSEVVIGIPNDYASSLHDGREGLPITVKTREGRPLFLKGNPEASGYVNGLSVRASSQILALYDPDRVRTPIINSQNPKKRGKKISIPRDWESLDQRVVKQLAKGDVRILTGEIPSPSLKKLLSRFASRFGAKIHPWTSINQSDIRQGAQASFGFSAVPKHRYDKAQVIVSVDGDFLGTHLNPTESTSLFSMNRDPEKGMSRLVSFQSVPSLTSYNADDNYPMKASQQLPLVLGLIHELAFVQKRVEAPSQLLSLTKKYGKIYESLGVSHKDFAGLVKDLADHPGKSLVVAGGLQTKTKDAVDLQIAVNFLNELLGNHGSTIHWDRSLQGYEGQDENLMALIKDMKAGRVKTLMINELNPLFSLPQSAGFKEALAQVEFVLVTNNWMDETAHLADVVAPCGHPMENWGDNEFEKGFLAIQQPTIRPLHNTRSFGDSLMAWSKGAGKEVASEESYYGYLKNRWVSRLGSEKAWMDFLQKGVQGSAPRGSEKRPAFKLSALGQISVKTKESPIELSLYSKVAIHDGTMANVSWLQELPDPVTKVVWDNYLMMSPAMAKAMNLKDGDMVEVKSSNFTTKLPVFRQPGMLQGSVAVAVGYGHSQGGKLEQGVGFNVQNFMDFSGERALTAALPVEIKKTGECYPLACTQGHQTMEGRQLAVETSQSQYRKTGGVGLHKHKIFSIWSGHKYEGHKWAMGVDLNSCTGCSACMVACQSENNIPVVGKKYVMAGREMHWIRLDRYFVGDENQSVDSIFQPVMCQHCENAPCETVCPVLATVHSDEGLNDMVYNRCVGTRYCSNNCPYKVRRFNWFYYDSHHKREPLHMALNPDVTVRTRGVMEKCTFCVQRIKEGKNLAKDEGRPLKDGEIKTACQEVCPTKALVFGDLNDPGSEVNQWFQNQRQYTLLEEVNAAPRVRYLAKIRNTPRQIGGDHHGEEHGEDHGAKHGDEPSHGDGHGGKEGHL